MTETVLPGAGAPVTTLATTLADLPLSNPLMVAAGCAGSGRELAPYVDPATLGALVTRSVTLDPHAGGPPPRVVETPAGLLVDGRLQGLGLQGFLATELPWLAQRGVRTVVSLAGRTLGEWAELARRVAQSPGVAGIELNLSWPPGAATGRDPYQAGKIVAAARRDLPRGVPVLVKVAADAHHVVDVARAVVDAGADVVVVGHGPSGLVLDPVTLRPVLGPGTVSGPATHPVALHCLWEVHAALPEVPLVGCGGVRTGADMVAMLAAGASAVQVGTTVLHDPAAPRRLVAELAEEVRRRGLPDVAALRGLAHRPRGETP